MDAGGADGARMDAGGRIGGERRGESGESGRINSPHYSPVRCWRRRLIRFDGFGPKRLDLLFEQCMLELGQRRVVTQNRFGLELGGVE